MLFFLLLVKEFPKVLAVCMAAKLETTLHITFVTRFGYEIMFWSIRCEKK